MRKYTISMDVWPHRRSDRRRRKQEKRKSHLIVSIYCVSSIPVVFFMNFQKAKEHLKSISYESA